MSDERIAMKSDEMMERVKVLAAELRSMAADNPGGSVGWIEATTVRNYCDLIESGASLAQRRGA